MDIDTIVDILEILTCDKSNRLDYISKIITLTEELNKKATNSTQNNTHKNIHNIVYDMCSP